MEPASKGDKKRGTRWLLIAISITLAAIFLTVVARRFDVTTYWRERIQIAQQSEPKRDVAIKGHIEQYKTMLLIYKGINGFYPSTNQGLKALITRPETEPKPRDWRQFLDKPIIDPWQQEYFYEQPGKHNLHSYDIYSAGPDRKPGTADDIGNWETPQG